MLQFKSHFPHLKASQRSKASDLTTSSFLLLNADTASASSSESDSVFYEAWED